MRTAIPATIIAVFIFYLILAMLPAAANNVASNATNNSSAIPASIDLKAERSHVTADEYDYVTLTAYVYDAQGNPVPDGTQVNFTIGNVMSNPFTGGYTWSLDDGSLTAPPYSNTNYCLTEGGQASVKYGWVPAKMGGNNSTIWAYVNGTDIHSTVKIYSAAPMTTWTGQVVNSSGVGYGGVHVTLHVMGYDSNGTSYEIYNMTRITSSKPLSAGQFAFDPIVLNGNTYCYVDTEVLFIDYLAIYNKSADFSMNRSNMSFGTIVLYTTPLVMTTASPTATARPSPAFEIIYAVVGLIIATYVFARKAN